MKTNDVLSFLLHFLLQRLLLLGFNGPVWPRREKDLFFLTGSHVLFCFLFFLMENFNRKLRALGYQSTDVDWKGVNSFNSSFMSANSPPPSALPSSIHSFSKTTCVVCNDKVLKISTD
jgi:hypothetical protein